MIWDTEIFCFLVIIHVRMIFEVTNCIRFEFRCILSSHCESSSYNKVVGNRHLTTSQDLLPFIAKAVQWCGMDLTCSS